MYRWCGGNRRGVAVVAGSRPSLHDPATFLRTRPSFARSQGLSKLCWGFCLAWAGCQVNGRAGDKNRVLGRFFTGCWANSTPVEVLL